MLIGVLTGGGDCPGLNAVIRGVAGRAVRAYGDEVIGFFDGWKGVLEKRFLALDMGNTYGISRESGTMIGTSRTNPAAREGGIGIALSNLSELGVGALVAIGGDDTLGVASKVANAGALVVGVPKTIDNDLAATEVTFGFYSAVQSATDAIDSLRNSSRSHNRVIVCEVMGRNAGWIALEAGIAGAVPEIMIPEVPFDLAGLCSRLEKRHKAGEQSAIQREALVVVVAEGASCAEYKRLDDGSLDEFGHPKLSGIGHWLANEIEARTGIESRASVLGHIQRGTPPIAYDRVLATRLGMKAVDVIHDGRSHRMVALRDGRIEDVDLADALAAPKLADTAMLDDYLRTFR